MDDNDDDVAVRWWHDDDDDDGDDDDDDDDDDDLDNFNSIIPWKLHLKCVLQELHKKYFSKYI